MGPICDGVRHNGVLELRQCTWLRSAPACPRLPARSSLTMMMMMMMLMMMMMMLVVSRPSSRVRCIVRFVSLNRSFYLLWCSFAAPQVLLRKQKLRRAALCAMARKLFFPKESLARL